MKLHFLLKPCTFFFFKAIIFETAGFYANPFVHSFLTSDSVISRKEKTFEFTEQSSSFKFNRTLRFTACHLIAVFSSIVARFLFGSVIKIQLSAKFDNLGSRVCSRTETAPKITFSCNETAISLYTFTIILTYQVNTHTSMWYKSYFRLLRRTIIFVSTLLLNFTKSHLPSLSDPTHKSFPSPHTPSAVIMQVIIAVVKQRALFHPSVVKTLKLQTNTMSELKLSTLL